MGHTEHKLPNGAFVRCTNTTSALYGNFIPCPALEDVFSSGSSTKWWCMNLTSWTRELSGGVRSLLQILRQMQCTVQTTSAMLCCISARLHSNKKSPVRAIMYFSTPFDPISVGDNKSRRTRRLLPTEYYRRRGICQGRCQLGIVGTWKSQQDQRAMKPRNFVLPVRRRQWRDYIFYCLAITFPMISCLRNVCLHPSSHRPASRTSPQVTCSDAITAVKCLREGG